MKRKLIVLGIVLLIVVNTSALVKMGYNRWCTHQRERQYECGHAGKNFLHRELALLDTQAVQIKVLNETLQANIKPIREALKTKQEQLVQLLLESEPDRSKIDSVLSEIGSLQAALQEQVIEHLLAYKKILTPEQQQKFFSTIRERLLEVECRYQTNRFPPGR